MAEKPQDPDWKIPREHSGAQNRDTVELSLLSHLGVVEPIQGHAEGPESAGATKLWQAVQHCATHRALPQNLIASRKGMKTCWGSFRKAKSIYRKVI